MLLGFRSILQVILFASHFRLSDNLSLPTHYTLPLTTTKTGGGKLRFIIAIFTNPIIRDEDKTKYKSNYQSRIEAAPTATDTSGSM